MLHTDPTSRAPRPRRRGLLVLAALVAVLALAGAACKQLDPNNRAANVPGVTNGKLPMSYLASTQNGCVVYDEALASLKAMIAHAAGDGVKLRGIGCYRDYAGQVAVREDWCGRGQCAMAAVPGTSNHGWGKAVDFADQSGELRFDSAGYAWLKQWAGVYGWMHPASMEPTGPIPEPWHWEWVGDGGKMYLGEYVGIGNGPLAVPRGLPFGNFEQAVGNPGGSITVSGWAIDPDQVASIPVHLSFDGVILPAMANGSRPDVDAVYPLYKGAGHGFNVTVGAAPGPHQVCVHAINVSGTGYNNSFGCRTVVVPLPSAPTAIVPAAPAAPTTPSTTVAPSTTTTTVAPSTTTTAPSTSTTVAPSPTTSLETAQGAGTASR